MFSFFKKKPPPAAAIPPAAAPVPEAARVPPATVGGGLIGSALVAPMEIPVPAEVPAERQRWMARLSDGLRKTGTSISQVFTGAQIDDALYEELETALLLADTGVAATEFLLKEVKRKVAASGATRPVQAKNILVDALTQLLRPLQKPLVIGEHQPTVIMVAGVNGAGKT
ncbi:MAG: signal recognition particle-docking protein FtsY, partial [Ramlibacter sp.]|nr:signal recognition particle-docking protein FtsY [Ramlibacter sp.]